MRKTLCTYTSTTTNQFGTWDRACTKKANHGGDHLVVSAKRLVEEPTTRGAKDQCTKCKRFMTKARLEAGFTTHAACKTSKATPVIEHHLPKETRMSTTSRTTVASLASDVAELRSDLAALIGALNGTSASTATAVAEPKAAKKASTKKAAPKATKAVSKGLPVTKGNRQALVAKAPWAKGLSTKAIAEAIVTGAQEAPEGFYVGAGYTAMFTA